VTLDSTVSPSPVPRLTPAAPPAAPICWRGSPVAFPEAVSGDPTDDGVQAHPDRAFQHRSARPARTRKGP
jgi:hypothetical protein